jgi:hypothetical protein
MLTFQVDKKFLDSSCEQPVALRTVCPLYYCIIYYDDRLLSQMLSHIFSNVPHVPRYFSKSRVI